ncbi:hypothetical protein ACOB87_10845 [Streptomyces sp. YS-B37]|uniref:hypothetical protein n=1 Tax=Streptomyces sp. YS-B37 TaxID=3407669 RepID=UPI003B514E49
MSVSDIATDYGAGRSWSPTMIEADYGSRQAIPVRPHTRPLGALTPLRRSLGRLAEDDVPLAGPRGLRGVGPDALVRLPEYLDEVITRVQSVIASKAALEIAKGMDAQYGGATKEQAGS